MKLRITAVFATLMFSLASRAWGASESPPAGTSVHAFIDVTCADDFKDYALKSRATVSEWYPRINEILSGPDHALPFDTIAILFEPGLRVPALTNGNVIRADCNYIKVMPDDYRAMIIHELTHVVQHYRGAPSNASWIVESIADYVRHKYFEKDIQETLRLQQNGVLSHYTNKEPYFLSLQNGGTSLDDQGYLKSYTVGATFLFWLEKHKDPQIVQKLNLALSQGTYATNLFRDWCGIALDDLWTEFVTQSKSKQS
jgi:hypothetical protein